MSNVLLSALIFTANFTAYTYLADILERLAGVPAGHVGWWLMGFGAVGLIGNGLGGRWLDRSPLVITGVFTLVLAVGLVLTMALAQTLPGLLCGLVLWGIANTALYPICQVRVMRAAPHAQALAGTLNVSRGQRGHRPGRGGRWRHDHARRPGWPGLRRRCHRRAGARGHADRAAHAADGGLTCEVAAHEGRFPSAAFPYAKIPDRLPHPKPP